VELFFGVLPFVKVAEQGGFRAAAAELGISAAAVSKAVARLEAELGVALFERSSRHVALTPEGSAYLARCREAVAQLQAGRDQVAGGQREPHGTLRVTLPPVLGRSLIPLVATLTQRHPRLLVQLICTDRFLPLAAEQIDVALRMGRLKDSGLVCRVVRSSRWVTVAAPAYLARRGIPSTPDDLAAHDGIHFVLNGRPVAWTFRPHGKTAVAATRARVLLDQAELLLDATEQGMGLAQVFDFMAAPLLASGRLVQVLAPFSASGPRLHAVTLARRASIPRVRAFLDALQAHMGPRLGARE
jgi:DNA-binding transcriptional LysR family regulator